MDNSIKKIYADASGAVTFVCQKCGDVRKEDAETYKHIWGPIKIQCKCGNAYNVQVEFRKFYRKDTKLPGIFSMLSTPKSWERMIVKNLSLEGCRFETMTAVMPKQGDQINVEFKLDDFNNSLIRKKAVVLSVYENYVGCKFRTLPDGYDPDLGFYLRKT